MDFVSHGLIGGFVATFQRPGHSHSSWWITAFAVLPDLPVLVVYLLLGRSLNRPLWLPRETDWVGMRTAHPIWSAMWEIPHSFFFVLLVVVPVVYLLHLPKLSIVAYLSHLFLDLFTHTGEWAVKPFYPLSWQFDGFTDAWKWPLPSMIVSWLVIIGLILASLALLAHHRASSESEFPPRFASRPHVGAASRLPERPRGRAEDVHDQIASPPWEASQSGEDRRLARTANTFLDLVGLWYMSYTRIITLIGTIAIALLGFSATFIVKDFLAADRWRGRVDFSVLVWSWSLLSVSVITSVCALLCVYNWYVTAIESEIRKTPYDRLELSEPFCYRRWGTMGQWGNASLYFGWIAGITLFLGLGLFVFGMCRLLDRISYPPALGLLFHS
ncbi:MAG: hypothetical protein ABSG25_05850 [Bryobacteraceae bacterium]